MGRHRVGRVGTRRTGEAQIAEGNAERIRSRSVEIVGLMGKQANLGIAIFGLGHGGQFGADPQMVGLILDRVRGLDGGSSDAIVGRRTSGV